MFVCFWKMWILSCLWYAIPSVGCFIRPKEQQGNKFGGGDWGGPPPPRGPEVAHISRVGHPWQIPVGDAFPRQDGRVFSAPEHGDPWGEAGQWLSPARFAPFCYWVCWQGSPAWRVGVRGPSGWSFKCIKAWDRTLVHPEKAVLPVNNLTCCCNRPFFLLVSHAACMFFCPVLPFMTFEMWPLTTEHICTRYSASLIP